ncbi:MAG TPA: oligopeptide/dipeptide ABC transporter ATP-binding protein [Stellaceae bacterium]|nr:oligopeptide/dipeptide ABC transporter ATP-binding protein [Stellaceae bacterium]
MTPLVRVEHLAKRYAVRRRGILGGRTVGEVAAVDGVSFTVGAGETLALVGESGCGKTTTARSMLDLVPPTAGEVWFEDREVLALFRAGSRAEVLRVRRGMQYMFQDPYLSLNPRWTIGQTLREPFRVHAHVPQAEWETRIAALLERVGLEPAHAWRFPHEFSGGQRQRVGVARALAVEPRFLILDEPVSSLDVSVRAQILNLLVELRGALGLAYLYISHDLASVRFIAHRVAVMYLGAIVETAPSEALFRHPLHHYTRALLSAVPVPDPDARSARVALRGEPPSAMQIPPGCRFHTRCPAALPQCRTVAPALTAAGDGRLVACHNPC